MQLKKQQQEIYFFRFKLVVIFEIPIFLINLQQVVLTHCGVVMPYGNIDQD